MANLQLFRAFPIREKVKVDFSFQADNALNSPRRDNSGTNISSLAAFGAITNATNIRTVMTSLRVRL